MDSKPDQISSQSLPKITGPIELIKSSFQFFIDNWKVLVPVAILPAFISFVGSASSYTGTIFIVALGKILILIGSVLSIIITPTIISLIQSIKTGSEVGSIKDSYKKGFSYFWSFILIIIINAFISLGSMVLFVIPLIIVSTYVAFYSYALVIEGKKGFSAFTESYSLVYKRWWPVFGRFIFVGLLFMVIWLILTGLGSIILISSGEFGIFLGTSTLNLISSAVFMPIAIVYMYELYSSLKSNRIADIKTNTFKNWLIAFLVIGIVVIPVIISVALLGGRTLIRSLPQNQQMQVQQSLQKALMELENKNNLPSSTLDINDR